MAVEEIPGGARPAGSAGAAQRKLAVRRDIPPGHLEPHLLRSRDRVQAPLQDGRLGRSSKGTVENV